MMSIESLIQETRSERIVENEGLIRRLFMTRFRIVDTDWVFAAVVVVYAPTLVFCTIFNTVFAIVIYSDPFGAKISTLYNFFLFWIVALLCKSTINHTLNLLCFFEYFESFLRP